MYELGYRHRKRPYKLIGLGICLVIIAGCVATYKVLHLTTAPQGHIVNGNAHTTDYEPTITNQVSVDLPKFSMKLPAGWSQQTNLPSSSLASGYYFHSASADARQLAVYIDNTPANMAINRALAVTAKGQQLTYGTVSDNCTTFTQTTAASQSTGLAPGLWQGANFICDTGNYERDVVGTVSTDGLNYVNLQSSSGQTHKVFLTYTDNGPSPNFGILYAILDSFQLK